MNTLVFFLQGEGINQHHGDLSIGFKSFGENK